MAACSGRIADLELPQKVLPLKVQLPGTYVKQSGLLEAADFGRVEFVAPAIRFVSHCAEIARDKRERLWMLAETLQLWMSEIAACAARQNLLRQERFPPQRGESDPVQVLRMWLGIASERQEIEVIEKQVKKDEVEAASP